MEEKLRIVRAAGIIDGEGSIYTVTNRPAPCVTAEMTDKDIIDELHDLFGGTICMPTKRQDHWKQSWRWTVKGAAAADCLEKILPYLFSRRSTKANEILSSWINYELEKSRVRSNIKDAVASYLKGEGSLRVIAEKYGVSYETVRRNLPL